jgi:hypothetical protein
VSIRGRRRGRDATRHHADRDRTGGDGWYVGNAPSAQTVTDPESPIVSQGYNCGTVNTIATDTIYAPVTCGPRATAEQHADGGHLPRHHGPATHFYAGSDAYTAGTIVTPAFSRGDPEVSGVASCAISKARRRLHDAGWHGFTVTPPMPATSRPGG